MKKISNRGFTIIELIVVIAIIAVLAGIVLVNVQTYVHKSQVAAVKADMAQFATLAIQWTETYGSLDNNNSASPPQDFFHDPDYGLKIKNAIESIGREYMFTVGYMDGAMGSSGIPCVGGKWVANYNDSTDNSFGCIDSAGKVTNGDKNMSNCACQ